ncbi:MAG: hypothetical protein CL886_08100 [Dehalococcoidia bacterium]|nr:hypothetical protein [Dehalococcoidia bacterium]
MILSKRWLVFAAVAIGTFCSVIDHGSISVALPSISNYFSSDLPTTQWVVIVFSLTIVILLLPMGRLGDILGLAKIYSMGCGILLFATIGASISPSIGVLLASRVLQGVGAAMTQGLGMALVISTFPENQRGQAIGLIMTTVGLGAIAGPAFGGLLVDLFGWRAVFIGNLPLLGISLGLAVAVRAIGQDHSAVQRPSVEPFDWVGAITSGSAILLIMMASTNPKVLIEHIALPILALSSITALIVIFVLRERRYSSPIVDLTLFKRLQFSWGITGAFLMFFGSSGVLFLTPFYLQEILGYSPKVSGLAVIPGAFSMAVCGALSGRLSDQFGWGRFTIMGLSISAAGLLVLSFLTANSSLLHVIGGLTLHSTGMGIFYSPNSSAILSATPITQRGLASSMVNLVRNSGSIVSVALVTSVVAFTMGSLGFEPSLEAVGYTGPTGIITAFVNGLQWAYRSLAFLVLLAIVATLFQIRSQILRKVSVDQR